MVQLVLLAISKGTGEMDLLEVLLEIKVLSEDLANLSGDYNSSSETLWAFGVVLSSSFSLGALRGSVKACSSGLIFCDSLKLFSVEMIYLNKLISSDVTDVRESPVL